MASLFRRPRIDAKIWSALLCLLLVLAPFPAFSESLSDALTPKGWLPVSPAISHPTLLLALKNPEKPDIVWNLTEERRRGPFNREELNNRQELITEDFRRFGITLTELRILSNRETLYSAIVQYAQRGKQFIAGILAVWDKKRSRVLYATIVASPIDESLLIEKLSNLSDRAESFLQTENNAQPTKSPKNFSYLLIGTLVSFLLLALLFFRGTSRKRSSP